MHPISMFLLSVAMSTDAFAAAIGKGTAMNNLRFSEALRAGVIFGTIEGLNSVIGWLLGLAAAKYLTAWDHWIAFTLLGLHMIYAGLALLDVNIGVIALVIDLTTIVMVTLGIMLGCILGTGQSRGKTCGNLRWLHVDRDRRHDFARASIGLGPSAL